MMTKSVWALAMTAVLAGAACSGDSGTVSTETGTTTAPTTTDAPAKSGEAGSGATTKPGGTTATGTSTTTATAGRGSSTPSSSNNPGAPVTTGNSGAAGAAAQAGAGGAAPAGAAGAGTAGTTSTAMDDSDAGVTDEGEMAAAGSGGATAAEGGAGGMSGAAGGGGMGGAAGSAAGSGGTNAAEGPQVPSDPAKAGPWPVGVRTVNLELGAGVTPVEVWYPAKIGSESERPKVSYDLTAWLPPEHGIPDGAPRVNIACDCYRELPPDLEHGQFPVVVVVHGQASFRAAAASVLSHWASRGFIAIAADHPGLVLRDTLGGNAGCSGTGIPQDFAHTRDVPALFAALAQPDGIFSFLKGAIDPQRVALAGHGEGAAYAADNGEQAGVKAVFSISNANVVPREGMVGGSFYLTGRSDKIVPYDAVVRAFEATARNLRPSLLAGMNNVGHLGFTDLCGSKNSDNQDAIAMARRYDICGGAAINVADQYFWDCPLSPLAGPDNYLDQAATSALVKKLSTLALEELVLGQSHAQTWNDLGADTTWGELRQTR